MTAPASATLSPVAAAILAARDLLPAPHTIEGVDWNGNKTAVDVNSPDNWQEWAASDANEERASKARLAYYRAILATAAYPVWNAFSEIYRAGAAKVGYVNTADLLSRCVYKPLAAEGINKPQSPTSSAARTKSAEAAAAEAKRKAAAEALEKMSIADIDAEISAGKADNARMATLFSEKNKRNVAAAREAAKKTREAQAAARKPLVEVIDKMDAAGMQSLLGFASAIVAGGDALTLLCCKIADAAVKKSKARTK
jgi:hypothetical protein